jgi:hypothetical protein
MRDTSARHAAIEAEGKPFQQQQADNEVEDSTGQDQLGHATIILQ